MRPVNLIPPDEQGVGAVSRGPLRTGPVAYIVVAALALALIMVIAIAVTSKQISDQRARATTLQTDLAAATERANSLRAFSDFRQVQEARNQTVNSLAQSRFDWERVLRELSLVLPDDVWLIKMTGTVNPAVQVSDGAQVQIRASIAGPALEIVGCAPDQDAVAGFVAALEDIDGVTRVGIGSSSRSDQQAAAAAAPAAPSSGAGSENSEDCRTQENIYQFEIAVAFDSVPVPPTASPAPSVPAPAPPTSAGGQLAESPATPGDSVADQTGDAQEATNLVPGAGG